MSHYQGVWKTAGLLRARGHDVAVEVGIPDGRLDVATIRDRAPIHLYEVKTRNPLTGIPQLVRYADATPTAESMTLVVAPNVMSDDLTEAARAEGICCWSFPFAFSSADREHYWDDDLPGEHIDLPYIHRSSIDRWQRRLRQDLKSNAPTTPSKSAVGASTQGAYRNDRGPHD